MKNYENFLKAYSVPLAVIIIMVIDKYVYDMPILVAAIVAGCLSWIFYRIIEKTPFHKKELNKKMNYILSLVAILSIFLSSIY